MRKYSAHPNPLIRARGFTLIEIMVVVIIIGLLAAVIVPNIVGKVGEARVAKARQDIQALAELLYGVGALSHAAGNNRNRRDRLS